MAGSDGWCLNLGPMALVNETLCLRRWFQSQASLLFCLPPLEHFLRQFFAE